MTHPTIESHVLMRAVLDVAGPKRVSQATGFALGTVYSWGRDPRDETVEGTGSANPFDRVEQLVETCATRGDEGRAAVVQMRAYFDALFERTLGARPAALTMERRHEHAATLSTEFSDVLRELVRAGGDKAALRKELAELLQAAERVMGETQTSELKVG